MTGNTFGRIFRVTTSGESYGEALLTIVDGVPPGLELTNEMIQEELDKRKPGQSALDSPRMETDIVSLVSGMRDGFSTGAPIGMIVYNVDRHDIHVQQYRDVKEQIRPGHAEYTFFTKYGKYADWCGAGRASGRESVGRVAGGAVAKQIMLREGIESIGYVSESHGIKMNSMSFEDIKKNYRKNILNCPDLEKAEEMIEDILKVKDAGDTAGGVVEVIVRGVPAGLGEPVFDKLRATIAYGIMGIGAVTGVEFGAGFEAGRVTGYEWNDEPYMKDGKVRFRTNRAGGFLGGISNGEDLIVRMAVKPTPTLSIAQKSIDMDKMEEKELEAITRRDPSICPRIYPVAEALENMAVVDALMVARGYDNVCRIENPWRQI